MSDEINHHRLSDLESRAEANEGRGMDHEKRVTRLEVLYESMKESSKEFITRQEFTPIRMIVYGLAATALTGLLSAILAKVFVK